THRSRRARPRWPEPCGSGAATSGTWSYIVIRANERSTVIMNLDEARLCLDCEEVHEDQVCPSCGSEAFAYLTRWVQPSSERSRERHPEPSGTRQEPRTGEQLEAYRQLLSDAPPRSKSGLVAKGAIGLAALGLAGWAWRATARPGPAEGERPDDGSGE